MTTRKRLLVSTTAFIGAWALALLAHPDAAAQRGGRLVIKGSDTLLPLSQQWAQGFEGKSGGATIDVTGGGSSVGITQLINGTCDIANSSRKIRSRELSSAKTRNIIIKEYPVARDGISIIVNPSNSLNALSVQEVARIYTGAVTNWQQVGGPALKVVASGRDTASGTYGFFQEDVLKNAKYRADMISTPSNNAIANNVANDKGGIGYVGVAYARKFAEAGKVKILKISFTKGGPAIEDTDANVKSGKYPISRYLYCYTAGNPSGLAAAYLKYVRGQEGQAVVEKVGYVPL